MREGWRRVPLGTVARLNIDRVPVLSSRRYPIAGVLNAGQGVFERETIDGSQTNYGALHRLHTGDLVMRKLTAWEGPITTVPAAFDGFFVSPEFPTYTLRDGLAPAFMRLICQQPEFWEAMRLRSTGTVQRRKRVNPGQLLKVVIDLPPAGEQRRIVDLVSAIDMTVRAANDEAAMAHAAYRTLARDLVEDRRWTRRPLGEAVDVRMGRQRSPQHATGDYMIPYLRAANVNDGSMKLHDVLRMNFTPVEQQTFGLRAGDVLVTEGCGSLSQLGASARWSGEIVGVVGFQNTLIRLRSKNGVTSAGFVHHLARHAQAVGWWARIASGTNIFHIGSRRAEILAVPVPPVEAQESLAAMLDAANQLVQSARAYSERLTSVRSAVLLDLLSGDHEIPGSYDRVLDGAA